MPPRRPRSSAHHTHASTPSGRTSKDEEQNRKLTKKVPQPKASPQKAADGTTARPAQSPGQEKKSTPPTRQSPRTKKGDKSGAISQNGQLAGALDSPNHLPDKNNVDVEPNNFGSAPQHEEEASKGAAEGIRKLEEDIVPLGESRRGAIDESTALPESLGREQEAKAATEQSVGQEKDEKGRVISQNERLMGWPNGLRREVKDKDADLKNVRGALQQEKESLKGTVEENRKLAEEVAKLRESHRRGVDESTALSQSFERERESKDAKLSNLQSALQKEKESLKRTAEENRKLTDEVAKLRESHRRAVDESTALSQSFKREREGKEAQFNRLRSALQKEKESLKGTVEENRKLTEEVAKLRASHQRAVDESTTLSQSFKRERESKDAELNNLRSALQQLQTKHHELATLLETRSRELKGAQVYLTKADALSGAEVISLVDALNVEILQASAFISDSFDYVREPAHADETKAASVRTSKLIGSTLAGLIGTTSRSDNDFLVQIALQSAAVEFSRRIIVTWDFDGLQAKQPLAKLYNDIRETGQVPSLDRVTRTDDHTETQAVGGRWRALTRAHARRVARESSLHATMVAHFADALTAVVVAAGCTKSHEEARRTFTQNFGERISDIVRLALRLNKVMGEEVTSADLRPVSVIFGGKFDAATMTNFDSRGENLKGQAVLCTTALGIQRSEKVVQGDVVEFKDTILLKPKVVVESVVDVMDGMTK